MPTASILPSDEKAALVGKGAERAIRASGFHTAVLAAVAALAGVLMYARVAGLAGTGAPAGAPAAAATPP